MPAPSSIVTIGGANGERVLAVAPDRYRAGGKHTVDPSGVIAGGSAVNHACRLLTAGTEVTPIAPVCRDAAGEVLAEALALAADRGGCTPIARDELFLPGEGLATPFTTIVNVGPDHTIFTEFSTALFAPFEKHLEARLAALDSDRVGAAMIGHLHADRVATPGRGGTLTERVVRHFRDLDKPVFVNFGSSQYRQGSDRWKDVLDQISCFQLDIEEARTFLGGRDRSRITLHDILEWFEDRCTIIVTMERMGAVGRVKGSKNLVLTWPYEIEAVDTTGAGDAFGAGAASAMLEHAFDSDEALRAAMERGGLFAAHACLTRGGTEGCPTTDELEHFRSANATILATEVRPLAGSAKVLRLLDQTFRGNT